MALYFADQPLLLEDPGGAAARWMDRYLPLGCASIFAPRSMDDSEEIGPQLRRKLASPNWSPSPRPEINVLRWPTGASRWACGLFLATTTATRAILKATANNTPAQLVVSAASSNRRVRADQFSESAGQGEANLWSLSTEMYLLPVRPITTPPAGALSPRIAIDDETLWLLPLVDERYFWQSLKSSADFAPETWDEGYSALGEAMGVTIETSEISEDYLTPHQASWRRRHESPAHLLDALAANVGHRIVRRVDGTVRAENYADAQTTLDENLEDSPYADLAGGEWGGSPPATVPEKVIVAFLHECLAETSDEISPDDAGFSHFKVASGLVKTFRDTFVPEDLREDLTLQVAKDYYGWLQQRYDRSFVGIQPWKPSGFDDAVAWSLGHRLPDGTYSAMTRVQTLPDNFATSLLAHSGLSGNVLQGFLAADLAAPADPLGPPATVMLDVYSRDPADDTLSFTGTQVEVSSYGLDTEADEGTHAHVHVVNGVWQWCWLDCEPTVMLARTDEGDVITDDDGEPFYLV